MIKVETLGMLDIAKINPVLTSETDVENYSFITDSDITYLVSNTVSGDDAYKNKVVIPAGEYLNGYQVDAWVGQKLVVDESHIAYGTGEDYSKLEVGTTILTVSDGKLSIAAAAPTSGLYFVVTDKTKLTEAAVKVRVAVA